MELEESSQDAVSQPFVEESSKGKDKAVSQPFMEESSKGKVKAAEQSTGGSFERLKLAGLAGTMGSDPSRMWMGLDEWVLDTRATYHWSSDPQLLLDRVKIGFGVDVEKGSVRTERFKIPEVWCRQGRERNNMVSVWQLGRDHGLVTVFEPTGCYVKDKAETIVGQGHRLPNGKYVLDYLDITKAQEKGIRDVKTSPDQGSLAGSQPEREWPDEGCWFGQTRLDRHSAKDPVVVRLGMLLRDAWSDSELFFMDSGACHHVTRKGYVLKAYHADLQIRPPIQSVSVTIRGDVLVPPVDGIGYIDSAGGSLDRVLFVPTSPCNVVSVSQLTEDYSVRVVFHRDGFWIEKLETKERIGGGGIRRYCAGYVLARLDVGAEIDWVLDSLAWLHHTSDRRLLHSLREKAEDLPPPAVGDQLQSLEHGSVGTERFKVPKVRYIAGHATRNVISVAQLAYDHGLVTVFESTGCHVKDKQTGQIVGKGRLCDGTYELDYLRIGQAQVQDVVDVSLPPAPGLQGSQELHGPRPQVEWLGEADRFGWPRVDRAKDPTIAVFQTLPHNQPRTMDFYMASGERHHMTWNGAILMAYHADMHINPPIQYVTGVLPGSPLTVGGIGYIDSTAGSLDRVLFVPSSPVNLVSISQLIDDCSVRVVFDKDEFWIEKLETKERIGHGRCFGTKYVVARLEVGAASDWVLDSFAWQHHTPDRRLLYDLQEKADDQPPPAVGDHLQILGSVRTKRFKVPKVRYIADHAARNAISVVQLADDHGLVTVFEARFCYVKDKETRQIVGQGRLRNGTYVLDYLRIDQDKGGGAGGEGGDGEEEEEEKGGSEAGGGGGEKKEKDKEGGGGGGETGGDADGEGSGDDGGGGEKGKKEGGGGGEKEEEEEEEEENDEEEKLKEPSQTQGDKENDEEEKLKEPSRAQGDIEKDEDKQLIEPSQAQGDMFGLLRFDRAPDQAVSDSCHSYHFLGSDVCAYTALAASLNQVPSDDVFVDSGACFHMTWNPSVLQRYPDHLNVVLPTQYISGVSGSNITVEYSGYINNAQTQLDGVLFVPESTANLVSVGQLTWQYYVCLEFDREVITIRRKIDGVEIGRANRRGNHYLLQHFRPGRLYVEKPSPNFWGPQHQFSA